MYFELGCRLVHGISAIERLSQMPINYIKLWEILMQEKENLIFPSSFCNNGGGPEITKCLKVFFSCKTTTKDNQNIIYLIGDMTTNWKQIFSDFSKLKDKGSLIINIKEMNTVTYQFLWILFKCFLTVNLSKPISSNVFDDEKYIICHGFKKEFFNMNYGRPTSILQECPLSWLSYISEIENKFRNNKESYQRKADKITSLFVLYYPQLSKNQLSTIEKRLTCGKNLSLYCNNFLKQLSLTTST